jgi:hypothetical protein
MSRHEIAAKDPNHQVFVGWDHPMQTFFVQVYDRSKAGTDAELINWRGTRLREIYEVDNVRSAVGRFAELTADMASTLYGDKDEGR